MYLYTGHDEAPPRREGYIMHDRICFSSNEMVNRTEHAVPLNVKDFSWAKSDARASQVIHFNNKFYWYVPEYQFPEKTVYAMSRSVEGPGCLKAF